MSDNIIKEEISINPNKKEEILSIPPDPLLNPIKQKFPNSKFSFSNM